MNLGDIELKIYDRLNFNAVPDSAVIRRMRGYVNDTYREIMGKRGFSLLRRCPALPAISTTSSPFMVLPQAVVKIINIADRTNNRNLDPISIQDLRYRDPGLLFSGSIPDSYVLLNMSAPVALDPSVAASLFVISDSTADGTGLSVYVEGLLSDGTYRRTSIALNGLTGVNVDTGATTWSIITKFYLSGIAVGNVTLRQTSGAGTELARITKGRSYARYTRIHLSPTPSSAITYSCDVELRIEDLANETDEPFVPEDFHWLFECGALKREMLRRKDYTGYGIEASNFKGGLVDLEAYIRGLGGVRSGGQRSGKSRQFSQLGWAFPAGS